MIEYTLTEESIKYYYENPYDFVVDRLKAQPTWQQAKVLRKLPNKKRINVRSGNGIGKTSLEAWLVLWFMFCFPNCRVPCTAPTNHQLHDVLWPEIKKWLNQSDLNDLFEWTATGLTNRKYSQTWFATARASSEPTNFQGFHEENILFVIDEASGVSDDIFEAIRGSLTTENAYCFIFGNPNYLEGFFYRSFHQNKEMWTSFHFSSLDSPLVKKEFIEEIINDYGIDSNQYRVRVLGEFPLEDSANIYIPMGLLKYSLVDAKEVWEDDPHADYEYDLGEDPAREGDDEAVFVISKHNTRYVEHKTIDICWGKAFSKSDGPFLMDYTSMLYNKWTFKTIYPDETGMGGFLYDFMKKQNRLPIYPVTFNKLLDPKSPIRDTNKEAMYKSFKNLLEMQRKQSQDKEKGLIANTVPMIIRIPNIPKLVTQIVGLRYEVNETTGSLSIHHEEGSHDDWADACVLSLFRYVKNKKKSSYAIS